MPKPNSSKTSAQRTARKGNPSGVSGKRLALEQKAWFRFVKVISFFVAGVYLVGVLLTGIFISREYAWVTRGEQMPQEMQRLFRMEDAGNRQVVEMEWQKKDKWNSEVRYQNYEPRFNWWRFARFVLGGWGIGILSGWLLSRAFYYVVLGKE